MPIDPKAKELARQLGNLLGCYVQPDDEGHAALELYEAFRDGLENHRTIATIDLPMCRPPEFPFQSRFRGDRMAFDLGSPEGFRVLVSNQQLNVRPTHGEDADGRVPSIVISMNENGCSIVLWCSDRNGEVVVKKELQLP